MEDDDTIICRCEEVTLREIKSLIAEGYDTLEELRRVSRCGMGPCQGRTCRNLLIAEIVRARGVAYSEAGMPTFRPPAKPLKVREILAGEPDED